LTDGTYNGIQISSGTAGDAETKANALFANIDMNNLAAISATDLKIIQNTHDVAEDAEVQAFNPAIAAASGDAATALQALPSSPCFSLSFPFSTSFRGRSRREKEGG
jgi:hypothetical protein